MAFFVSGYFCFRFQVLPIFVPTVETGGYVYIAFFYLLLNIARGFNLGKHIVVHLSPTVETVGYVPGISFNRFSDIARGFNRGVMYIYIQFSILRKNQFYACH
ncbi:hypothetical protein RT99_01760 [Flavobacterium sp. MEB061]|jgi:hypothetical protein|uniref:hypothetical protein n=1 Tax=Flavobacterium sp. MEB061 TaxID=1587524 RepID=UPI0005AC0D24|nr:hypothetical protein [Flavobacterium sp. MEB061]KIQ24835.1 hypothetical protein RT99_01760 [Flavobacterium sp. MEB061]